MKFGVREICDVVFKTTAANQQVGNLTFASAYMPVLYIDTAKTSTLEGAATTVYAQGGKGNSRLLAWEGEKTLTFTVEDAMLSPLGMSVLTGAGLVPASTTAMKQHVMVTVAMDSATGATLKPVDLGMASTDTLTFATGTTTPFFGTQVDKAGAYKQTLGTFSFGNGVLAGTASGGVTVSFGTAGTYAANDSFATLDFYITRSTGAQELSIDAESFGGYYYVEASTLFRDQATGKDLPAEFIIPSAKIQSNFTFNLASTGDPSTFSFVMDAFPAPTRFGTKPVLCAIQIIG